MVLEVILTPFLHISTVAYPVEAGSHFLEHHVYPKVATYDGIMELPQYILLKWFGKQKLQNCGLVVWLPNAYKACHCSGTMSTTEPSEAFLLDYVIRLLSRKAVLLTSSNGLLDQVFISPLCPYEILLDHSFFPETETAISLRLLSCQLSSWWCSLSQLGLTSRYVTGTWEDADGFNCTFCKGMLIESTSIPNIS